MAKVKSVNISVDMPSGGKLSVKVDINVNSDGIFYAKLPPEYQDFIYPFFESEANKNEKETWPKKGQIFSKSMEPLEKTLRKLVSIKASSGVKKEILIIYSVMNQVTFFKTEDGNIFPNGTMTGKSKGGDWGGNKPDFSDQWSNYSVRVYAKVMEKTSQVGTNAYTLGYPEDSRCHKDEVDSPHRYMRLLNSFNHLKLPPDSENIHYSGESMGDLVEIPYTEDRAKFFYELILGMCKLGDKLSVLNEQENVLKLADNGTMFLTDETSYAKKAK